MPRLRLTSLLLVEERLLEAEYFARRLKQQRDPNRFGYELNAFVSAARSVTFLLQKEMGAVPGFAKWWAQQRTLLSKDPAATFFLKLRNYSQKESRISVVGSRSASAGGRRWSHRFAGNPVSVPASLIHRDVADCCRAHVAKLAKIIIACTEAFPFYTCPKRALTPEGVTALQLSLEDAEETLGFPRGWSQVGDPLSHERRVSVLREHVDGLNLAALRRLARWKPGKVSAALSPSEVLSAEILTSLVAQLDGPRRRANTADLALSLLLGGPVYRDP